MNISTLGKTIRRRRRELGLDQRKLANLSGMSVHTVSDIESGKGNPTVSTLETLLNAIGLELTIQPRQPDGLRQPSDTDDEDA